MRNKKYKNRNSIKTYKLFFNFINTKNNILKNINFNLNIGNILFIKGKNGIGKTTLNKLLTKKKLINKGLIKNFKFKNKTKNIYCTYNNINKIYKFNNFYKKFKIDSLLKNNLISLNYYLKFLKLKKIKYKKKHILSLGEIKKLTIKEFNIKKQNLIILDEPLIGLDIKSNINFKNIILQKQIDNITIIITTHQKINYYKNICTLNLT